MNQDTANQATLGAWEWHATSPLASFPGLHVPRFFCSSVSVDNNTRMRKGGEKRPSASMYYCQRKPKNRKNGVGLGTRLITSSFSLRVVSRTAVISSTEKLVVSIVTKSVKSCPPPVATGEQATDHETHSVNLPTPNTSPPHPSPYTLTPDLCLSCQKEGEESAALFPGPIRKSERALARIISLLSHIFKR